jgi:hypothetical protein
LDRNETEATRRSSAIRASARPRKLSGTLMPSPMASREADATPRPG